MRVVFISSFPPDKSGIADYTKNLIDSILTIDKTCETIVICPHSQETKPASASAQISNSRLSTLFLFASNPLKFCFYLTKALLRSKATLLHIQYPLMSNLKERAKATGPLSEPLLPLMRLLSAGFNVPAVVTLHDVWSLESMKENFEKHFNFHFLSTILTSYYRVFMVLFLKSAKKVIVHSNQAVSILVNQFTISKEKIAVIPHGISSFNALDPDFAKSKLKITAEHVILFFGYIWYGKGIEYLVRAIPLVQKSVPNVHLVIAGPLNPQDGMNYLHQLEALVKDVLKKDDVTIDAQYIPSEMVPVYFSAASVVVLPYIVGVGSSGILNLAFGFGKPVVCTDVGPRGEELEYGKLGLLIQPQSSEEITDALCKILSDKKLSDDLVKNITVHVEERSWVQVAKKTLKQYAQLLQPEK